MPVITCTIASDNYRPNTITNETIEGFAAFLGIAFGGDSQYDMRTAGQAIRGQVSNGGWWGYTVGGEGTDDERTARFCQAFAAWHDERWHEVLSPASDTLGELREAAGLSKQ